jgi:hypothetical protein
MHMHVHAYLYKYLNGGLLTRTLLNARRVRARLRSFVEEVLATSPLSPAGVDLNKPTQTVTVLRAGLNLPWVSPRPLYIT